jgi:hypothetical protein
MVRAVSCERRPGARSHSGARILSRTRPERPVNRTWIASHSGKQRGEFERATGIVHRPGKAPSGA